jgi:hypothetical protein
MESLFTALRGLEQDLEKGEVGTRDDNFIIRLVRCESHLRCIRSTLALVDVNSPGFKSQLCGLLAGAFGTSYLTFL